MKDYVIKRGYVKWTDEDGVFHKEPLSDHPELLQKATPQQQLQAEEARRLNQAADKQIKETNTSDDQDTKDTLDALKKAPDEVKTASELVVTDNGDGEKVVEAPASAPEDDGHKTVEVENLNQDAEHQKPLEELAANTAHTE